MRVTGDMTIKDAARLAALSVLLPAVFCAAQMPTPVATDSTPRSTAAAAPAAGTVLDRIVAVVNGDVLLESDVDEEQRFEEIIPYRGANAVFNRDKAMERLIDRHLIQQQAALEPEDAISDKDLDSQVDRVKNDIAECKQYSCNTDGGWAKYLAAHGFTAEEFRDLWRKRMQLLRFIEVRFRNGLSISPDDIETYYTKTMLPEYKKQNATPPPLNAISKRIEEVLLQQQVGALLDDWLKSLRAQGSVKVMTPGEVMP